jgi:type VI secretion system protein ImpA
MSKVDWEKLLAPVSELQPCGLDKDNCDDEGFVNRFSELRFAVGIAQSIVKQAEEIRWLAPGKNRDDRLAELKGRSNDPSQPADWNSIQQKCAEILEKDSKDMRVVVWLIESTTWLDGWQGFIDSVGFCTRLIEKYQYGLWPNEGDEDTAAIKFLESLNSTRSFELALQSRRISASIPVSVSEIDLAQWITSRSVEEIEQFQRSGTLTLTEIEKLFAEKPLEEFQRYDQQLEQVLECLQQLHQVIGAIPGAERIGLHAIRDKILGFQKLLHEKAGDRLVAKSANGEETTESNDSTAVPSGAGLPIGSVAIRSRTEAIQLLKKVAEYFRKAEPHSPISYSLEQSIQWSDWDLPKLLEHLVESRDSVNQLFSRIGIARKE